MERLIDNFIELIAKRHSETKPQAVERINACLEKISREESVPYRDLYATLYSFTGLTQCLAGSCEGAELSECRKMCHCVVFKEKCVPRYIPYAPNINADPDKWLEVRKFKLPELENFVEYASFLYYNYDGGGLTDNAFDAIEYALKKRTKAKGRRWEKIGAEPVAKLRTQLPYPMPSLEKIKPDQSGFVTFLQTAEQAGMIWSGKLDGVSGLILWSNGEPIGIYTRGDGSVGGDVTYLKDYIKLPELDPRTTVAIRGEFVLPKKVWTEKYSESGYANPRSFVSAKINTGYISPALKDIDFVAYEIVDGPGSMLPQSQVFEMLSDLGFKTPTWGKFSSKATGSKATGSKAPLVFDVITRYKSERKTSPWNIDGLVLVPDAPNKPEAKAFKMLLEEQLRDTRVVNIDWGISRYGRYVPVAVYEAIYLDGVRLTRATAHNARYVTSHNIGKGTKIKVARSGDVIPAIKAVHVDPTIKPIMPSNKWEWEWVTDARGQPAFIDLVEIETNPEVHIKRLTHFFTTLAVPKIGEGTIRNMYNSGLTTIKSILTATPQRLQKVPRIGPKTAKNIHTNIREIIPNSRIDRFYDAITMTKGRGIKSDTLRKVLRVYPDLFDATESQIRAFLGPKSRTKIKGIGPKTTDKIAKTVPKFKEFLLALDPEPDKSEKTETETQGLIKQAVDADKIRIANLKQRGLNPKIKDKNFVMTGYMGKPNYRITDYLWDNGGNIADRVTANTTAVIAKNISGQLTPKLVSANKLGIPVYTEIEFIDKFMD